MSQYNLNGFNRSPFDVKPEYNVSWVNCTFLENVTGSFGTSADDFLSVNINEKVTFGGTVTPVRFQTGTGSEIVSPDINVESMFYVKSLVLREKTAFKSNAPAIIVHTNAVFNATISGNVSAGFDLTLDKTFEEEVSEDTWIGFHQNLTAEGYELVSAVAGAEAVQEYVCNLDIEIPPGSTLVVDSNNYNVLLDGENAIWTQSGDWLDNLNRETISLNIQAASGGSGLTATVLYTERYL